MQTKNDVFLRLFFFTLRVGNIPVMVALLAYHHHPPSSLIITTSTKTILWLWTISSTILVVSSFPRNLGGSLRRFSDTTKPTTTHHRRWTSGGGRGPTKHPPLLPDNQRFHTYQKASNFPHPLSRPLIRTNMVSITDTTDISSSSRTSHCRHNNPKHPFVDIGANLLDDRFMEGIYFGTKRHESDWEAVMDRAMQMGMTHMIITAGTVQESQHAIDFVRRWRMKQQQQQQQQQPITSEGHPPTRMFLGCTVGVHPTRCQQEFIDGTTITATSILSNNNKDDDENENENENKKPTDNDQLQSLVQLAKDGLTDGSVVALGEMGLDYDRLEFSPKDIQQQYLIRQLEAFGDLTQSLPLFLHNRNVGTDLLTILQQQSRQYRGVVHSFDDTLELAQQFIAMGLYVGINGCSLKTEENLQVIQKLPLESILLETDSPYCEIKPTHASFRYIQTKFETKQEKKFEMGKMVKGRNEPCRIIQVAEVIAGVKGIPLEQVTQQCYRNSLQLYGWQNQ